MWICLVACPLAVHACRRDDASETPSSEPCVESCAAAMRTCSEPCAATSLATVDAYHAYTMCAQNDCEAACSDVLDCPYASPTCEQCLQVVCSTELATCASN
jgi:hypothetical protein